MKKSLIAYIILTFFMLLLFSELAFSVYISNEEDKWRRDLEDHALQLSQLIQEDIVRKVHAVDTLASLVEISDYDPSSFDAWATTIYNSEKGIASVQLAPDGIVQHIYPLASNEGAIGHNLLKDYKRNDGAIKAITCKDLVFVGPLTLIQNGKQAIISRRPIYQSKNNQDVFWGFAVVVIYTSELKIEGLTLPEKYSYQLLGDNPDSSEAPIIYQKWSDTVKDFVEYPITVPGGQWQLIVGKNNSNNYLFLRILSSIIAMLLGSMYSFFHIQGFRQNKRIRTLNKQLEQLTYYDELTSILNRRGIYKQWSLSSQKDRTPISIIITDLNKFKLINDTYGHGIGDLALKYYANILKKYDYNGRYVGRLGGDEFILLLENTCASEASALVDSISDDLQHNLFCFEHGEKRHSLRIESAIGVAVGSNKDKFDVLLSNADHEMYKEKKDNER